MEIFRKADWPNSKPTRHWQVLCVPVGRVLQVDHRWRCGINGKVWEFPFSRAQIPELMAVEMDGVGHLQKKSQHSGPQVRCRLKACAFALLRWERTCLIHWIFCDWHYNINRFVRREMVCCICFPSIRWIPKENRRFCLSVWATVYNPSHDTSLADVESFGHVCHSCRRRMAFEGMQKSCVECRRIRCRRPIL